MKNTPERKIVANLAYRSRLAKKFLAKFEAQMFEEPNIVKVGLPEASVRQQQAYLQGCAIEAWNAYAASRQLI